MADGRLADFIAKIKMEKIKMKKIFALLMILVLPMLLLADVASYVSKADAEKGAVLIKKQKEIKNFCGPCDDTVATTQAVKEVKAAAVPDTEFWNVTVNGEEKDLAYIYYKTDDGKWRNIAIAIGIKVDGFDMKDLPEFIPASALK